MPHAGAGNSRLDAERDGLPHLTFDPQLLEGKDEAGNLMSCQRLFDARLDSLLQVTDQLKQQKMQIASRIDGVIPMDDFKPVADDFAKACGKS